MERKRKNSLLKYLKEYKDEISNDENISESVDLLIKHIEDDMSIPIKSVKKKDINDMLDLLDNQKYDDLRKNNIKLEFEKLLDRENLINILENEDITRYTVNELKIVYYLLTKEKNEYIMKSKKKEILTRYVSDVLIDIRRSKKLIGEKKAIK